MVLKGSLLPRAEAEKPEEANKTCIFYLPLLYMQDQFKIILHLTYYPKHIPSTAVGLRNI